MADYTKTTNFTAKDALTTGNALKVIKGSYFDTEFDAIVTAIATKYDSDDIASTGEAQALILDTKIITPSGLNDVLGDNAAMLQDIQALTDPGADTLLGWDDSASAAIGFTIGAGLSHAATELNVADAIAGAGLAIASSILSVGGGAGITANANDVALTDAAAGTSNPIDVSSGTISLDVSALTNVDATALDANDEFVVEVDGNPRAMAYQDMGVRVQAAQATQTLALGDANTLMEFNGTATLTIPLNSSVALPVGCAIIIVVDHATQVVTVDAAASVTLNSVFHPGGTASASDTVNAGGMAVLVKIAADEWYLSGDTSD